MIPARSAHIILPAIPPSGTDYLRMHWGAKKRLREDFGKWLRLIIMNGYPFLGKEAPPMSVAMMIYRKRLLDKDNLYGGTKPLIDAMRDIGLIRNDSPKWLDLDVDQKIDKANLRTEISIKQQNVPASGPAARG